MSNNNVNGTIRNFNNGPVKTDHQTTNHIYLHPGHQSGEFESWMRKIGGLLQITAEAAYLKPLLDLLVAVAEPERMFLYTFPAIDELNMVPCHEIRLVFRKERIEGVSSLAGFVKLASFKHRSLMITLQSNTDFEENLQDCSDDGVLCFREEFLVFSNSPYRLRTCTDEHIKLAYDSAMHAFNRYYDEGVAALQASRMLLDDKHYYQAYSLIVRVVEQIYNAIICAFGYSFKVGLKLFELKKKAAQYLPQLFYFDYDLAEIEELSLLLVNREQLRFDSMLGSFDHTLEITEEFMAVVKPCFESKLNYLLNYSKGGNNHG